MILGEDALVTTVLTGKDIGAQNTVERLLSKISQSSSGSFVQEPSGLESLGIIWRVYQLPRPGLGEVEGVRYDEMQQVPG